MNRAMANAITQRVLTLTEEVKTRMNEIRELQKERQQLQATCPHTRNIIGYEATGDQTEGWHMNEREGDVATCEICSASILVTPELRAKVGG